MERQPRYYFARYRGGRFASFIPLTVGGGVRTVAVISGRLLNAGADKASINTAAVTNPDLVNEAAGFGSQAIVVAVDAKAVEP